MSAPLVKNTGPVLNGFHLRVATVTLTNAQIKALPTTGIELIAAQGSGKRIVVVSGVWRATTTSGAYTNINATLSKLRLVYGNNLTTASEEITDITAGSTDLTALIGGASIKSVPVHYWQIGPEAIANVENVAVNIDIDNNGSGDLTGGNVANSLVVTVLYTVI